jgi:hypothetical protein
MPLISSFWPTAHVLGSVPSSKLRRHASLHLPRRDQTCVGLVAAEGTFRNAGVPYWSGRTKVLSGCKPTAIASQSSYRSCGPAVGPRVGSSAAAMPCSSPPCALRSGSVHLRCQSCQQLPKMGNLRIRRLKNCTVPWAQFRRLNFWLMRYQSTCTQAHCHLTTQYGVWYMGGLKHWVEPSMERAG